MSKISLLGGGGGVANAKPKYPLDTSNGYNKELEGSKPPFLDIKVTLRLQIHMAETSAHERL